MGKYNRFPNKREHGQVLVIVALMIVGLIGLAALLIDGGMMQVTRREIQAVADASALAGGNFVPGQPAAALSSARDYVINNGLEDANIVSITTPFEGDSTKIEVILEEHASFTFGRIFDPSGSMISARAVAMRNPKWAGEALPFINLDDNYDEDPHIELWEKVAPGDKEKIIASDFELHNQDICSLTYFTVDFTDGIEITEGKVAPQKQEVDCVYQQNITIYLFSLRSDVIESGQVKLADGTYRSLENLKNKDVIALDQLVLLECRWDTNGFPESLELTVLDVYDVGASEYPENYYNPDGGTSTLVE